MNYFSILDQLGNYNKDDEVPQLEKFGNNLYFASLFINEDCNFNCVYCFYHSKSKAIISKQGVNWFDFVNFFNSEGKSWLINISGGEPFMYRDIYKLVSELTKEHFVWINSNMTVAEPDVLIKNSCLSNLFINASYHYKILDECPKLKSRWKDYFFEMKQAGTKVEASIVAYPKDFKYSISLYERILDEGIYPVTFLTYKGLYKGKRYPENYTKKQKEKIFARMHGFFETCEYNFNENFELKNCLSGYKEFSIDHEGNIYHCDAIKIGYGTIIKPHFFNKQPIACPLKDKCRCGIQGLLLTSKK
jgi:MoaA/NifB/PqqE/SkfB family radical SAM enzyme